MFVFDVVAILAESVMEDMVMDEMLDLVVWLIAFLVLADADAPVSEDTAVMRLAISSVPLGVWLVAPGPLVDASAETGLEISASPCSLVALSARPS
jgi:hypothetical protein